MVGTEAELASLVDSYLEALAGGEVLEALRIHADKAGINLKYIDLSKGTDHGVIYKVFKAAEGQHKLKELLSVVREEGFKVPLLGLEEEERVEDDFDDSAYRKWLKAETEYVDIRGIGERRAGDPILWPILELYTELYVQTGLTNFDLDQGRIRGRKRIPLTEMMSATRYLVIMGDPGSGKTTFLHFVARTQVHDRDKPLPIYLRLRDVYEFAMSHRLPLDAKILIDFCLDLSDRENLHLTRNGLKQRSQSGECLWLLDALDELPSPAAREQMVEEVVQRASRRWDRCKFVLTSRPRPLRGKAIPKGFELVGIDYWRREEIRSFLQAWTSLLYPKATEEMRRRHWGSLLATILERPELQSLARNALMVTAMAVVHYNERRLPEGRADLLEAVIYWLVRAKSQPSDPMRAKFIEDTYRELALAMFEAEEGRRDRVGRLWAAERIAKYFDGDIQTALEFLGREEIETGVLVRRGEGDLAFWQLSFQEYLAAKQIAGKTDDEEIGWWSKVRRNLDKPEWREVLILVPACLNRLGGERVDLFFERLGRSCAQEDLATKARRVGLGGSILRDLRLTGYVPRDIASWTRALNDVLPVLFGPEGEDVALEDRYDAAVAYGLGSDDRLRDFEETWVPLPGGVFLMGAQAKDSSAPSFDPDAAVWEGPVREILIAPFEIRKYPIIVQEFKEFISDGGYQDSGHIFWTEEGWQWRCENEFLAPLDWEEQLLAPNCPVTGISWFEANAYCSWLTSKELREAVYRLPSEAEWEYAARRGLPPGQRFPWGNSVTPGDKIEANFAWSGLRKKTPVGMFTKCITADGVVDMFGNVEEWCADSWSPDHTHRPKNGKAWRDESVRWRVVRGGSTIRFARLCRPTYRSRIYKDKRYHPVGFRPVRVRVS